MTRVGNSNIVSLSLSNWAGVILTIISALAGQWFLLQSRISALEITTGRMEVEAAGRERRLLILETSLEKQRDEWLRSINDLRDRIDARHGATE